MEGLVAFTHKMVLITESAVLLTQAIAASITPPAMTVRARLKVAVSGSDPTGTVSITGLDGTDAVSDTLTFTEARPLITDYFYTVLSPISCSGLTGTITISLVDEANQDIMAETESAPVRCTFREVSQSSRLYQAFGIVDGQLFYLRCSSKVALTATTKFRVAKFDGYYRVARPIKKLFIPGTNISREIETYAMPA